MTGPRMLPRAARPPHRRHRPSSVDPARRPGPRALLTSALVAIALAAHAARGSAQTVVEVQGGGSSLTGGYGAAANFWRNGVEGWVGLGYLDGLRVGAFAQKTIGKDTLRLGNDALVIRYPTDVFGNGYNLLVQGASYIRTQGRTAIVAFGGASSEGQPAPAFFAAKAQAAMGA